MVFILSFAGSYIMFLLIPREPSVLCVTKSFALMSSARFLAAPAYWEHGKITGHPVILWEQLLLRGVTSLFIILGFQAARLLPVQFFAGQSTSLSDFRRKQVAYVVSWKISVLEGSWGKNMEIRSTVMIKNCLTDLVWFHLSLVSRKCSDWRQQGQI